MNEINVLKGILHIMKLNLVSPLVRHGDTDKTWFPEICVCL